MNITGDQERCGPDKADQPEETLHANSAPHGHEGNGCCQAEYRNGIPGADRLHDLAP
jgi:hypothetical protein